MNFKSYIPFYKRNLSLATPVIITQTGQMIVQFADNIMVGHLGTTPFAGVAFANTIITILLVFFTCFTQGLIPHVGHSYGRGEHKKAADYFTNAVVLDALLCIFILFALFATPIMDYMGQDAQILPYAKIYYTISVISLIPLVMFFAIRNFAEGIGITKHVMYITIVCNILNIVLNWILIYGKLGFPALGVAGAAYATLISRILMFIVFTVLIFRIEPYKGYIKLIDKCSLSKEKFLTVLKTSIPISLQALVEVSAFNISGIMVGWFGQDAMAANQIALTMTTFSFMAANGVGVAATIRVAHQFGEKRYKDAQKAGFAAMHISIAMMVTTGLIYIIFRNYIPYIFVSDPAVTTIASSLIIVAACFQVFDATQLSNLASLRGLADVKAPLVYSIIAYYIIGLSMSYILSSVVNIGPIGVWWGLSIGLIVAAITYTIRFKKITSRYINSSI
ncbi:MAG: MATE family efflux transporter [Bacteroidia bacterium]|nr:MATE family efflux transporter [Bacteroidia bacterium]